LPQSVDQLRLCDNKISKIENLPIALLELGLISNCIQTIENLPPYLT